MSDPLPPEAFARFDTLYARAHTTGMREPSAMALATVDSSGQPAVRMVLLRGHGPRGFVFFTNQASRKGGELADGPRAALCFFWDAISEQVRVEGPVELVTNEENDAYWRSRPRMSQIASAASDQSRRLPSREEYLRRVEIIEHRFAGQEIPRPAHWIGYRVIPERIEFWTGREARMHDRDVYEWTSRGWDHYLLYP